MPVTAYQPWLTFDCYDTLVRYTESKTKCLTNLVRSKGGSDKTVATARTEFEVFEKKLQLGKFMVLTNVLRKSLHSAMDSVGMTATASDEVSMIEAVKNSNPVPDVHAALKDLQKDYRLAILSNSEPEIIKYNIASIGIDFDAVVLASEAMCYKPATRMFHELLDRIGEPPENVTHIAQSFYHDMRTTKDLGFGRRLWINRYKRACDTAYMPDKELSDLSGVRAALTD